MSETPDTRDRSSLAEQRAATLGEIAKLNDELAALRRQGAAVAAQHAAIENSIELLQLRIQRRRLLLSRIENAARTVRPQNRR